MYSSKGIPCLVRLPTTISCGWASPICACHSAVRIVSSLPVLGPHQMQSRGITIQEAAAYLSTTVPAIRRLISTCELPFTKLGKRFIIDRQDLDKWLEKKKHLA